MRGLFRRRFRAGQHADSWFWHTYRPWRRRARFAFLVIAPVEIAIMMSLSLLTPGMRQFYAGVTVGMLVAMYVCLIDSPPEWIDRKRRGRDAERSVEKQLLPLEHRGWRVVHDVRHP